MIHGFRRQKKEENVLIILDMKSVLFSHVKTDSLTGGQVWNPSKILTAESQF